MSAADDYAITVGWFGELDKPRYEAILASASRAAQAEDDPFVGVAEISRAEFDAAVSALRARGLAFADGRPTTELDAYAVIAVDGGDVSNASLGLDPTTAEHVAAVAAAVQPAHRAPLVDVIAQVRTLVNEG